MHHHRSHMETSIFCLLLLTEKQQRERATTAPDIALLVVCFQQPPYAQSHQSEGGLVTALGFQPIISGRGFHYYILRSSSYLRWLSLLYLAVPTSDCSKQAPYPTLPYYNDSYKYSKDTATTNIGGNACSTVQ